MKWVWAWTYRRGGEEKHVRVKACFMRCSTETHALKPHNRQPQPTPKNDLNLRVVSLWKGAVFSGYSPSEHRHIPNGTARWDSALFSDHYPVLPDIYRYDNRNVTVCFSFSCSMPPLPWEKLLKDPSYPHSPLWFYLPKILTPARPFLNCFCHSSFLTFVTPRGSEGLQQQWHPDDWKHGTDRWKAF